MEYSTVDDGRCARNDGKGWCCKSQCFGGSSYCEKHYHYLHIKSKSKPKARVSGRRAEVEGSSTADEDRCVKKDGKGWRCKSRRSCGTRYCKKHYLREASRVRVSGASASKKTKKKQSTGSTVDDGRCTRSDGRGWRCSSPRCGGRRYCEKHYLQRLSGAGSKFKGRVSQASVEEEEEKKLEEGEALGASNFSEINEKMKKEKRGRPSKAKEIEGRPRKRSKLSDRSAEKKRLARPWKEKKEMEGAEEEKRPHKKSRECETEKGGGEEEAEHVSISAASFERKKRGRPSKSKNSEGTENVNVSAASIERKMRGRPSKSKNSQGVVNISAASIERKKRSRPSKSKNSEGTENVCVSAASVERKKLGRPSKSKNSERTVNVSVAGPSFERKKSGSPSKPKNLEGIEKKKRKRPAGRPPKKSRIELGGAEEAGRILELGQVWAFPKESDGFARSYARIDSIIPLPLPSVVRVTPLVPHPVTDDEKLLAEQGFSLACGLFKASESTATKEISAFTQRVQFEIGGKRGSFFKIFPKEGEIWAIYLRWDALTKTFDYQLVEVESDFDEEDGVKVFAIVKVEGRDGVYRRQEYAGFHLVRSFSRGFMSMFSHKVPSSRIVEGGELLWKVMLH